MLESIDESILNKKVTKKLAGTCSYAGVLDLMAKSGHNLRNKIIWVGSE